MTNQDKNDIDFAGLFEESPELAEAGTVYEKEVLAHFGLLFSRYAVLERGLQLCFVHLSLKEKLLSGNITNKEEWTDYFDEFDSRAVSATLGNLLRMVGTFARFDDHLNELRSLKEKRDYFAHHFFREEVSNMQANDSILFLMERMRLLRLRVDRLSKEVDQIHTALLEELYPHIEIEVYLSQLSEDLKREVLENPNNKAGWELDGSM